MGKQAFQAFDNSPGDSPVIPVWRELLCDGWTPVGIYHRLRQLDPTSVLLESVHGGERWARYSFIAVGFRARIVGRWDSGRLALDITPGEGFSFDASRFEPLEGSQAIERIAESYRCDGPPELPRFWGGLVGVWGHDIVRDFEKLEPPKDWPPADLPAVDLLLTDTVVIFDNLSQKVHIVATACPGDDGGKGKAIEDAQRRIAKVLNCLREPARLPLLSLVDGVESQPKQSPLWSSCSYPDLVRKSKQYIQDGDVFQLVLSQRFDDSRASVDPLDVYRILRVSNPSPYMYMLELPSATLTGASPEVLFRLDGDTRKVVVRPIAGTRPRGATDVEDKELEADLLADPKERAEHLMLIDLGRNDVGRISQPGTVQMEESFRIERYSHVMHIVSEVSGRLSEGLSPIGALRSIFPAGTLSGAPKVRALQLIDELEPAPRGWYGGAVGYVGYNGGADFAICIRSVVFKDQELRVQAGAGLVFDSNPDEEDRECHRKAAAVIRAVAMARAAREARLHGEGF